jgi:hypothetical protein
MLLNTAENAKIGTTQVERIYRGTDLVWQHAIFVTVTVTATRTLINSGESTTLTATLSNPKATGGTIQFRTGSPTGPIVATDTASPWEATVSPTVDTTYYAEYLGSNPYQPAISAGLLIDVAGVTNLVLATNKTDVAQGTSAVLTATISGVSTGTINFRTGSPTGPIIATDTASPWTVTVTPTADTVYYAEFLGTPEQMADVSNPITLNFYIPTTTTISASSTSITAGTAVTLTAVVAGITTGTVNFRSGSVTGPIVGTKTGAPWTASVTPTADTTYFAEYLGSGDYAASNSAGVTVNYTIPVTISIAANDYAVAANTVITVTATVTAGATGTVYFYYSTNSGGSWVNFASDAASPYSATLSVGANVHLYAEFIGTGNYGTAGSNTPYVDMYIATALSLTSNVTTINNGGSLTLTATLTGGTGTVYFRSGSVTGAVVTSKASAPYTVTVAPTADVTYYATYSASGDYLASNSAGRVINVKQVVTKTWSGYATWVASYDGGSDKRSGTDLYYGYYSSTWGNQRSLVGFAIPDLSGCIAVTSARFKFYNEHHFQNSGGDIIIALHDYASEPSTWSGSRVDEAEQTVGDAPKPGWVDMTCDASIRDKLKTLGVKGFGFGPGPSNSQSYYGYVKGSSDPWCEIKYTVWE